MTEEQYAHICRTVLASEECTIGTIELAAGAHELREMVSRGYVVVSFKDNTIGVTHKGYALLVDVMRRVQEE